MPRKEDDKTTQIRTRNQETLDRMNLIADQADGVKAKEEFEDVMDVSPPDDIQVEDPIPEPIKTDEVDNNQNTTKLFKVKVHGEEREITEDELIAGFQKNSAADANLQATAEALRIATEGLSKKDVPSEEEEEVALARAIQMGSEEEAVKAIRKLRQPLSKTPDVAQQVDERLALRTEQQKFNDEFKDVLDDPNFKSLVYSKDAELAKANPDMPYQQRWRKAAKEVQDWKMKIAPKSVTLEDKAAKKSLASNVPGASGRAAAKPDEEEDDDPRSVIEKMATARHQERPVQH